MQKKEKVNLIYHKSKRSKYGNFGDELSKFIISSLINKKKFELIYNASDPSIEINLLGIGSIFKNAKENSHIFGTGIRIPNKFAIGNLKTTNNLHCVRGPLTQKFLYEKGLLCNDLVYGDPALLLPKFYKPKIDISLSDKIGLVPHLTQIDDYIDIESINPKYHLIKPTQKWENVINEIASCEHIVSSSLHGLICSDAYGIPNIWLNEIKLNEGNFKFFDYFFSQNRPINNIQNLNTFSHLKTYKKGNRLPLDEIIESFPFN